jgi:hypothetical protein
MTILLRALFIFLCVCVYAYAIWSLVLLTFIRLWAYACRFDCFEVVDWILRSWRFGALEMTVDTFSCCKCLFVICFFLECLFDAKMLTYEPWGVLTFMPSDLNVLCIEKFFWEVWRCLDFKRIWLGYLECEEDYLRGLEVFRVQKHMLEYFECLRMYLRGLEVIKVQSYLTWVFWMFKGVLDRFGGGLRSSTFDLNIVSV